MAGELLPLPPAQFLHDIQFVAAPDGQNAPHDLHLSRGEGFYLVNRHHKRAVDAQKIVGSHQVFQLAQLVMCVVRF